MNAAHAPAGALRGASIEFHVAAESGQPICQQLLEQVRRLVAAGQLSPGDALPSARELARTLQVNAMTVSRAFSLMRAEGLVEHRRGKSMVVAGGGAARTLDERIALLEPVVIATARQARELDVPEAHALALLRRHLSHHSEQRGPA